MGFVKKAIDNGKKLAKASAKLIPKGKKGEVKVEEPEETEEEMEVEETPVEEEGDENIDEEIPEAPKAQKKEINVGEIITFAKEIGYAVIDADGKPIECKDRAEAILVSNAIKNEKATG